MMLKNDKIFAKFREKKLEVVIAEDVLNNAEIIEIYTGERDKEIYNKAIDDCIRTIIEMNFEYAYPHTVCNILEMLKGEEQ